MSRLVQAYYNATPLLVLHHYTKDSRMLRYVVDIGSDLVALAMATYTTYVSFAPNDLLCMSRDAPPPAMERLGAFEMAVYTAYTISDITYHGKTDMLLHHVCAITLIEFAFQTGAFHLLTIICLLSNASTPFLTSTKAIRYAGLSSLESPFFAMFAATFFACRIIGIAWVLYNTIFFWQPGSRWVYVFGNGVFGVLYAMQWVWCGKIAKIVTGKQRLSGQPQ